MISLRRKGVRGPPPVRRSENREAYHDEHNGSRCSQSEISQNLNLILDSHDDGVRLAPPSIAGVIKKPSAIRIRACFRLR